MAFIGIDLGTTNSLVSVWKNGKVCMVPNAHGTYLTPSVVSLDKDGSILVGEAAKERLITHPDRTASAFKRCMGSPQTFPLGEKSFRPEELSAFVLQSLKADAEAFLGEPVTQAIISVPAYFNELQRKATKIAGTMAGLQVERLINEPTAAAIAYGVHDLGREGTFLVFDLGGGTFDVSILELFDRTLEVHASAGDTRLGGEDFLEVLQELFQEDNNAQRWKLSAFDRALLRKACEKAKIELSTSETSLVECRLSGQDIAWPISRVRFEEACAELLSRLQQPVQRALHDAKLQTGQIDEVFLVGGATRMPKVQELVQRMFGKPAVCHHDPDQVVGLGAGVQATLTSSKSAIEDVVMTDVCPFSLGIEIATHTVQNTISTGHFLPIIERNTTVPVSRMNTVSPVHKEQKSVQVKIYQGEHRLVANNLFLGEFNVPVPKGAHEKESIEVRFTYDINGLLEVEALVKETGLQRRLVIESSPGAMSPEEIQSRLAALAKLKIHPRDRIEFRRLLAMGERLYEENLGPIRALIADRISHFETALESQDMGLCKEAAQEFQAFLDNIGNGEIE